jgi:sugar phosphate permease
MGVGRLQRKSLHGEILGGVMLGWLKDQISRTTVANIVAAVVILITAVYAYRNGDTELLKAICLIATGYLFGVSTKR